MESNPGDLVWLHLMKDRFPTTRKNKLMVRGDGQFQSEKVGYNAYELQLLGNIVILATFIIEDLCPHVEDYFEDP